jgi:sporulation protein YlmC with PRC-barrel domain
VTLKEVGLVEDGDLVSFSDLVKVKVFDGERQHIGHLEDLAIESLSSPKVTHLAVHFSWSDRVGIIELVRPVEDIVLLLTWSQVESFDEDGFRLTGVHPDIPVETAAGKLLLRADLLDKQILDSKGTRIQRVDDIYIERKGNELRVIGLEVSRSLLLGSSALRHFVDGLRKKYGHTRDVEMIPLEAVQRVDEEAIVVGEVFHTED